MNWFGAGLMIVMGGAFAVFGDLCLRGRRKRPGRKPTDVELEF